jgi:hypothetical protein
VLSRTSCESYGLSSGATPTQAVLPGIGVANLKKLKAHQRKLTTVGRLLGWYMQFNLDDEKFTTSMVADFIVDRLCGRHPPARHALRCTHAPTHAAHLVPFETTLSRTAICGAHPCFLAVNPFYSNAGRLVKALKSKVQDFCQDDDVVVRGIGVFAATRHTHG